MEQRVERVLADTAAFYAAQADGSWVPGYLAGRGLVAEGRVGYAPAGWTTTRDHLRGRGHSDDDMLAAGVVMESSRGSLIDVMRDRATVPVCDARGALVAFLGRAAPGADTAAPKWLNTPATQAYRKSSTLLGLGDSSTQLSRSVPVIVEGPWDVVAVEQVSTNLGLTPVAPCGTALTDEHVEALVGAAPKRPIAVAFDGDVAGRRATLRAWETITDTCQKLGTPIPHLVSVELPAGLDPADLVEQGRERELRRRLIRHRPLAHVATEIRLELMERPLDLDHAGAVHAFLDALLDQDMGRLPATASSMDAWARNIVRASGIDARTVWDHVIERVAKDDVSPASTQVVPATSSRPAVAGASLDYSLGASR